MKRFWSPKLLVAATLFGLGLLLSACGGGNFEPATQAQISALKAAAAAPPALLPGEKLHVLVYDEPSLTGDFTIDPSGYLALPVVGTMKVAGMTSAQLRDKLVAAFRAAHIKDPGVTVEVVEFKPFYILGEVDKPGTYPYIGGLDVMRAIAIAGGQTYRANQSKVLIQHVGETTMHSYVLDWPIPIMPGDIIQIPRRYI
jgi:protein involved in polysaccharide export with SLBB domain